MQEAKRYEGWNVTHTVPYEVLNVTNMVSGRQAWRRLYAWTHGFTTLLELYHSSRALPKPLLRQLPTG